jgi:hypothetical protein
MPFAPPIRLRCLPPAMNPVKSTLPQPAKQIRRADLQDLGGLAGGVDLDADPAAFEQAGALAAVVDGTATNPTLGKLATIVRAAKITTSKLLPIRVDL